MIISVARYFKAVDKELFFIIRYGWRKYYNKFFVISSIFADNRMNARIRFSGSMIFFVSPGFIECYICPVKARIAPVDYEPKSAVWILSELEKWFFDDSACTGYFFDNVINFVKRLVVDNELSAYA